MAAMEIVDTHIHLWTTKTHPWIVKVKDGGHPAGKFDKIQHYMLEEFARDYEGFNVTKAVYVQCFYEGKPQDETKWVQAIADNSSTGIPNGIVGYCDLKASDVDNILQEHCNYKNFRGIRQLLNYHPDKPIYCEADSDDYLTNPKWLEGLGLLTKYNLSFDLHCLPRQMASAYEVVKKFPNLQFILDHCGLPYEKDDNSKKLWRQGMTQLGSCANVTVKLSGGFATDPHWTHSSAVELIKDTIQLFTPQRSMFASNFPVDKVSGTYSQWVAIVTDSISEYTSDEQQMIMSKNATKVYRLF